VQSLQKTECVESLSAGKQHAHSETCREGFTLQKNDITMEEKNE
jgi:hypothetical protein